MVKKIELWVCEICQSRYEDKNEAKACEALGKPQVLFKKEDTVQDKSGMGTPLTIQDITIVRGEREGKAEHIVQYLCISSGSTFSFNMSQSDLKAP